MEGGQPWTARKSVCSDQKGALLYGWDSFRVTVAGPKARRFAQPRPTAWGRKANGRNLRPNGPTVRRHNDERLGRWPAGRPNAPPSPWAFFQVNIVVSLGLLALITADLLW